MEKRKTKGIFTYSLVWLIITLALFLPFGTGATLLGGTLFFFIMGGLFYPLFFKRGA